MGSASVPKLMQACIDGVRAAGATSQYIFVEGIVRSPRPAFHSYSTNSPFPVFWGCLYGDFAVDVAFDLGGWER
jgi:hypothetical protein